MKIALTMFPINNLGGIINHTETLGKFLKKLGHEVDVVELCYQERFMTGKVEKNIEEYLKLPEWEIGAFGIPVSQNSGWVGVPHKNKMLYKHQDDLERTREALSKYDLIIWEWPVPTKRKDNIGNLNWLKVYDIPVKQVVIIHDDNFQKSYPWLNAVKKNITALACVHPCGYNLAAGIDIPRAMIVNPQNTDIMNETDNWNERKDGFISAQNFKACKKVEQIVRAVPYMDKYYLKLLAGGGLMYAYMVSPTKCPPKFHLMKYYDPDLPDELDGCGKKIFDYAVEHGMKYLGFISATRRDQYFDRIKFLLDASWCKGSFHGDLFNRVVTDGIVRGVVPIACNLGVAATEDGIGTFFKPDETYLMIPYDSTPKQFAEYVNEYMHISKEKADYIRNNNFQMMKDHFDGYKVAQSFIDLSELKPCGYYNKLETGELCDLVREGSDAIIRDFFSADPLTYRKQNDSSECDCRE